MKLLSSALLLLALLSSSFAQPPDTLWTRTFFGNDGSGLNCVHALPDGGFLAGGRCCWNLFHEFFTRAYVGRFEAHGANIWNRSWWGTSGSFPGEGAAAYDVQPLADGGSIVATGPGIGSFMIPGLLRLDANGDSIWWRAYPIYIWGTIAMRGVCTTADGGFAGVAHDSAFVFRTDSAGNPLRATSLYPADLYAIAATPDSGCVVAGSDDATANYAFYLAKLNASGDTVWTHRYPLQVGGVALSLRHAPNGGFLLTGKAHVPDAPSEWYAQAVAVDANGNLLWQQIYVSFPMSWNIPPIVAADRCAEGGYILLADRLLRINENGDTLWTRALPDPQADYRSVCQTTDSGYVVAGERSGACYLAKFGREGLSVSSVPLALPSEFQLSVFPNPFNPSTTISFSLLREARARIAVFDLLGREVEVLADKIFPAGEQRVLFNGTALPSGAYFARLQSGATIATQKLLLLK